MRLLSRSLLLLLLTFPLTCIARGALDVSCGFFRKATEAQKAELQGFVLGYFQGYANGLSLGDSKRDLYAKGASTPKAHEFLHKVCATNPNATLQDVISGYVIGVEAGALEEITDALMKQGSSKGPAVRGK